MLEDAENVLAIFFKIYGVTDYSCDHGFLNKIWKLACLAKGFETELGIVLV